MRSGIKKTSGSRSIRGKKRASAGSKRKPTSVQLREINKRLEPYGLVVISPKYHQLLLRMLEEGSLRSFVRFLMPASAGDGSTEPPK